MRSAPLLMLLVACGPRTATPPAAPPIDERAGVRCDPVSSRNPAPPPPDTGAVCGNGVAEDLAGTCVEVCSGGCDGPVECRLECTKPREHCDGAAVDYTCESQGYAGGAMACTPACELDDAPCIACVPSSTSGVRCGAAPIAGDEPHVVATATAAAVFVRDYETGALTGAKVDAQLRASPFTKLPQALVAAGALDGGLGYVDDQHRFGVVDADTGRARILGPVGAESTPVLILRETFHAGGGAVLTGDHSRRTLATFDPQGTATGAEPRHFYLGNLRVVVVPGAHELARGAITGGDLVVIAFGNERSAYQRDGLELTRLTAMPPGLELAFTYPTYTDTIRWSSGQLATTRLTGVDPNAPPAGLSRAALSGAPTTAAFGGTLMARPRNRARTELYWLAAPDPLAPSR